MSKRLTHMGHIRSLELLLTKSSCINLGFPRWLSGKESPYYAGEVDLNPGSRRSSGAGNGNPFQYSCLGNPMDTGAWQATVPGVAKSRTWQRLNNNMFKQSRLLMTIIFRWGMTFLISVQFWSLKYEKTALEGKQLAHSLSRIKRIQENQWPMIHFHILQIKS